MTNHHANGRNAALELITREMEREAERTKRVIAIGATGRDLPSLKRPSNHAFDGVDKVLTAAGPDTYDGNLADYIQERWDSLTAVDPAFQLSAFDEEDTAVLEILSGPTKQEMIEAVRRFNRLITEAGYNAVDYETAVGYLESNHFDPLTAYNEYVLCNPYSADEALTAAERNR